VTEETSAGLPKSEQSSPQNEHFEEVGTVKLSGKEEFVPLYRDRLDNKQFVARLMDFSPRGGLAQVFVIEAIRAYCEAIVKEPKPTSGGDGIVNLIAWYEVAQDIKRQCDAQYGSGPEPTSEGCEDEGCPHYGTPHGHATP
jgi:hypothetical protein